VSTQNKNKLKKIKAVIHYIENNSVCKSQQLLTYFDEPESMPCGTCNVCRENKGRSHNNFEKDNVDLILEALKVKPMTSRELVSNLSISSNEVIAILRHLLEVEQIQQSQINEFQIKCP
jgi:ATP-dependent DNA helicase RecQ